MPTPQAALLQQLANAINTYNDLQAQAKSTNGMTSSALLGEATAFVASAAAAIQNATGRQSVQSAMANTYVDDFHKAPHNRGNPADIPALAMLKGLVEETHRALINGSLLSYEELLNGEIFSDFLEMANHLLADEGLKEPAAVIAGTSLEVHLKKLCVKHGIAVADKAAKINDDLKKQGVYSGLEHKQVIAWQQLRNYAAHGEYDKFDANQVASMIQSVRDLIAKYPA